MFIHDACGFSAHYPFLEMGFYSANMMRDFKELHTFILFLHILPFFAPNAWSPELTIEFPHGKINKLFYPYITQDFQIRPKGQILRHKYIILSKKPLNLRKIV